MNEEEDQAVAQEGSPANAPVDERQLFSPGNDEQIEAPVGADSKDDSIVTWEASEYIHHKKSFGWYAILTASTLLLGAVLYFLLRDLWSLIVIAVMYLVVVVYAHKEPRILRYSVGTNGMTIGEKHFEYDQFRSFSVLEETGVPSIALAPSKRFMPSVSIYFPPEDAEKIISELTKFLPHEQIALGPIDRAMVKLRF